VYEQHRIIKPQDIFPADFWTAFTDARDTLDECDRQSGVDTSSFYSTDPRSPMEPSTLLVISKRFMQLASTSIPIELLYIFMLHCILLPDISVRERARQLEDLNPALLQIILDDFLPPMMLAITRSLTSSMPAVPFDMDGKVFCSLIRFSTINHSEPMSTLVGEPAYSLLAELWDQIGSPSVNLSNFAARFPHPASSSALNTSPKGEHYHRLLSFDNDVFSTELSLVHVPVSDDDDLPSLPELDFGGRGTQFSDTQHWHNQRAILPAYLGGSDSKPLDERARRRMLRSNQRFMATMQAQAATLVGASGGVLKKIIIPPVGLSKRNRTSTPTKVRYFVQGIPAANAGI
jgi:hypothetical protein